MKKGDIIKYNSNFDFNKIPPGSILKIIYISPQGKPSALNNLYVRVINNIKHKDRLVCLISIDDGKLGGYENLNYYSFEIIRYGAK